MENGKIQAFPKAIYASEAWSKATSRDLLSSAQARQAAAAALKCWVGAEAWTPDLITAIFTGGKPLPADGPLVVALVRHTPTHRDTQISGIRGPECRLDLHHRAWSYTTSKGSQKLAEEMSGTCRLQKRCCWRAACSATSSPLSGHRRAACGARERRTLRPCRCPSDAPSHQASRPTRTSFGVSSRLLLHPRLVSSERSSSGSAREQPVSCLALEETDHTDCHLVGPNNADLLLAQ